MITSFIPNSKAGEGMTGMLREEMSRLRQGSSSGVQRALRTQTTNAQGCIAFTLGVLVNRGRNGENSGDSDDPALDSRIRSLGRERAEIKFVLASHGTHGSNDLVLHSE
jgi:hypothetical protein